MGSKGTKGTYFKANFISLIHYMKMGSLGSVGQAILVCGMGPACDVGRKGEEII